MQNKNDLGALDIFRIIAATLVVIIHAPPLYLVNETGHIILSGAIARIAVPFFFAVTGLFTDFSSLGNVKKVVGKSLTLYAAATVIYLPYGTYYSSVRALLFDGTFYHLWYFPALITGTLIVFALNKLPRPFAFAIASLLYAFGLCGDSYTALARNIPAINAALDFLSTIFSFTRNGIFFAPIFLVIGNIIGEKISNPRRRKYGAKIYAPCLALSLAMLIAERLALRDLAVGMCSNMFISLVPCAIFLLLTLGSIRMKPVPVLRTISTWVYIVHPVILELGSRIFGITDTPDMESAVFRAITALLTAAFFAVTLSRKKRSVARISASEKLKANIT